MQLCQDAVHFISDMIREKKVADSHVFRTQIELFVPASAKQISKRRCELSFCGGADVDKWMWGDNFPVSAGRY